MMDVVGMPLPVVQHAMTRDGLDPSIMECDHNKPAPAPKSEGVPLKDDPAYAKYFKVGLCTSLIIVPSPT